MELHHPDKKLECFLCPICGKEAPSLSYHLRKYHAPDSACCDICGKRFLREEGMKQHRKLVHFPDENDFVCKGPEGCGRRFLTEKQWKTHLKQKAEGKRQPPKNQTCELCGERFPIKDALTRHL